MKSDGPMQYTVMYIIIYAVVYVTAQVYTV